MHCPGDGPQLEDGLSVHRGDVDTVINTSPQYNAQDLACPGMTQAHGVLLLIDPASLNIRAVSANVSLIFGESCDEILNKALPDLLTSEDMMQVRQWAEDAHLGRRSLILSSQPLSLSIYEIPLGWICEFEPLNELPSYPLALEHFRGTLDRIRAADTVQTLLEIAVDHCCRLTGFERGMAYRFDARGAGEVLAEVKPDEAIAYLGLHFPASDIPEPVRQMYAQGSLRYVPNLQSPFYNVVSAPEIVSPEPLDLSRSRLRSVDDCCITYHQNMGVAALMVLPLLVEQKLWGLITLHHSQPLYLSLPHRDLLEMIGQSLGLALANRLKAETLAYEAHLKQLQSDLIQAFSESEKFEEVLIQPNLKIMHLVRADGVALCLNNGITLMGETPDGDEVLALLKWAKTQVTDFIYVTDQLSRAYEPARDYCDKASGVLLLRISEQQNISILWFRAEQKQQVTWAGNPNAPVTLDPQEEIGPRQSFEHWQELIQYTSAPWLDSEIETARGLRAAISGVALRRADELARMNQELAQSNEELASFAYAASHDLKEPLRGIYNYTTFLIEDYAELLDDAGIDRMHALLKLTKRMDRLIDALLKFAQMRQADLNLREIDLQKLLDSVVDVLRISRSEESFEVIYPRIMPSTVGDAVLLTELFSNLLSNALKYNDSDLKVIEVGYLTAEEQINPPNQPLLKPRNRTLFYLRDNGIGIKSRHQKSIFRLFKRLHARDRYGGGTGAGLTIVKKIIERHGGEIAVESSPGQGTTFWFSLT